MQDGIRNATIANTFLGVEDHGLFILSLTLDYGGSVQGYQRILGADAKSVTRLRNLLEVVDVESWEKLRGQHCRARVADGLIAQIGHIVEDSWTVEP